MSKPKIIKAYDALDNLLKKQLIVKYPYGFDKHLISFSNAKGKIITALPYETEDRYYLIKMTSSMAAAIVSSELEKAGITDSEEEDYTDSVVDLVEDDIDLSEEVAKEAEAA